MPCAPKLRQSGTLTVDSCLFVWCPLLSSAESETAEEEGDGGARNC